MSENVLVNKGALKMVINILERGTDIQKEAAQELKKSCIDIHQRIAELEQQLSQEREANRWIPVSERLPEDESLVLVISDNDVYLICGYDIEDGFYSYDSRGAFYYNNITHWKPIN